MIHEDIKKEMVKAMKDKDATRLSTLRALLAAFTNEIVAQKRKPDEMLSNADVLKVIKKQAKQRQDSIVQFEKGGRSDLAETEKDELRILDEYLPTQMADEEILKIATAKKEELGITDKNKMGMLMGAVMKETKGQADGNKVKEIVSSLL